MKLYNATMYYVEVLVGDASYHGSSGLTYSSEAILKVGALVTVPLKQKSVLGIVTACTSAKPSFKTKPAQPVVDLPALSHESLQLLEWLVAYYPAPLGVITQQFLPKMLPKKTPEPLAPAGPMSVTLPPLTTDQEKALARITDQGMHILHGDTGTGKTRIYLELAKKSVADGRSAIILTPEIGLTSQLADTFRHVFGERVVVIHSQLTEVTRQKLWVTLLEQTEPVIVIGPRSALFSPLKNIGLIVIDESHETSYKQDQSPYYHATYVASKLAALHKAPLILGSATPLVSDYYFAEQKQRPILRMTQTAAETSDGERTIDLVDLRDHDQFSKKSHLSDKLIKAISKSLQQQEQVLLFLNRRGTARVVMCEECGWQATCPHCDLPLVYHNDHHLMRCHSCSYHATPPTSCPTCHNTSVIFKSIGTKAIADEVSRLFPEANVMRFDTDNKKDERIEQHYTAVKAGEVDILVGTQTLAKGLDLPKLGLVGVVVADTSLYVPDYSSQERTFELLTQVIGRVGRGHRASRVIIQTYGPESPLLQSVLNKDWDRFYSNELRERKAYLFPPFCYTLKAWCRRATQSGAQAAAQKCADELRKISGRIIVEGPVPSFHEKVGDKYQWQLIVKAKNRAELLKVIQHLPTGWLHDIDPMNLL